MEKEKIRTESKVESLSKKKVTLNDYQRQECGKSFSCETEKTKTICLN